MRGRHSSAARRVVPAVLALVLTVGACADGEGRLGSAALETPPQGSGSRPVAGSTFVDPQGTYQIDVDPEWDEAHGVSVAEVEQWFVADVSRRFRANVNVLTQVAEGADLAEYMEVSRENAESFGFDVEENGVVTGANGQELGLSVLESRQGGQDLKHLAAVIVHADVAVVATLTTLRSDFDEIRPAIEPYLRTLRLPDP